MATNNGAHRPHRQRRQEAQLAIDTFIHRTTGIWTAGMDDRMIQAYSEAERRLTENRLRERANQERIEEARRQEEMRILEAKRQTWLKELNAGNPSSQSAQSSQPQPEVRQAYLEARDYSAEVKTSDAARTWSNTPLGLVRLLHKEVKDSRRRLSRLPPSRILAIVLADRPSSLLSCTVLYNTVIGTII